MENTVINLQPIITSQEDNPTINSFYLYIFAIFEFLVIILILYYFFYIEIIFLYNMIFKKDNYSVNDKNIYNKFMEKFKEIVEINKTCITKENQYYPVYKPQNEFMKTLDNNNIYFDSKEICNNFLNS